MTRFLILMACLLVSLEGSQAQVLDFIDSSSPQATFENVPNQQAIQIIESVCNDLNYPLKEYDATNKILVTDYIEWSSIAFVNHARLKFQVQDNTVTIAMIERAYKSENEWVDNPTKISKKNIKKYITSTGNQLQAIAGNNKLSQMAVYNSQLIKCFKPSFDTDANLRWEFVSANEDVPWTTPQRMAYNFMLVWQVTNLGDKPYEIQNISSCYVRPSENSRKGKPIGNDVYTRRSFHELVEGKKENNLTTLPPGEAVKFYILVGKNTYDNDAFDTHGVLKCNTIGYLEFRYSLGTTQEIFKNYNIPFERKQLTSL